MNECERVEFKLEESELGVYNNQKKNKIFGIKSFNPLSHKNSYLYHVLLHNGFSLVTESVLFHLSIV